MKIISACLLGLRTTYAGGDNSNEVFLEMLRRGEVLPVCPEQLGGMSTPRPPSEIRGGNGADVIKGAGQVYCRGVGDVTENFLRGAQEVLRLAKELLPEIIIFKEYSPSCGVNYIYDGTFSEKIIEGMGVCTALLRENGFRIVSEEHFLNASKNEKGEAKGWDIQSKG